VIRNLHHIGIAVRSVDEALPRYVDQLGMVLQSVEEVPTERVRVAVLMAGDVRIELLEPSSPDSPIARFLDKRGPGIHHLAFEVDAVGDALAKLVEAGVPVLDDAPRPGAHDTKVVFVHPKYLGGVLAELVEMPR
jgi:methylmalonyl-CoA epimerase